MDTIQELNDLNQYPVGSVEPSRLSTGHYNNNITNNSNNNNSIGGNINTGCTDNNNSRNNLNTVNSTSAEANYIEIPLNERETLPHSNAVTTTTSTVANTITTTELAPQSAFCQSQSLPGTPQPQFLCLTDIEHTGDISHLRTKGSCFVRFRECFVRFFGKIMGSNAPSEADKYEFYDYITVSLTAIFLIGLTFITTAVFLATYSRLVGPGTTVQASVLV